MLKKITKQVLFLKRNVLISKVSWLARGVSMMTTTQTLLSGKVKSRVDEHINCNYHNGAKCQANAFVRAEIMC